MSEKVRTYANMNKDKNNGVNMCKTIEEMFKLGSQYFDGVTELYTLEEYASGGKIDKEKKNEIS